MPELPEVTNIIDYLKNHEKILNKTINKVDVFYDYTIDGDIKTFKDEITNQKILDITRKGKYIIFHLSNDLVIVSHLRMEGKFFVKNESVIKEKHDLVMFHFTDNTKLVYNDTRRFGRMILSKESAYLKKTPLSKLGPEPLDDIKIDDIKDKIVTKNIGIKQLLLDQSIMSGIGNIYADEICFACNLNPRTPGKFLDDNDLNNIIKYSKIILNNAILNGGSTIKTYHISEDKIGSFQSKLKVYGREGKPCFNCGHIIRKIFINGRGTCFCPHCQKDKSLPFVLAISGPIASGKSSINAYFVKHGFISIDLDEITHKVYKDKNMQNQLKELIPTLKIVDKDIDRVYLKSYLIEHHNIKNQLEDILYSYLYEHILKQLRKIGKNNKVVMDVPLLFKSHLDDYADKIMIVQIDKDKQEERLLKRNGETKSYLKINESYYLQEDIKKADYLISNNSSLEDLYNQLDKIIKNI